MRTGAILLGVMTLCSCGADTGTSPSAGGSQNGTPTAGANNSAAGASTSSAGASTSSAGTSTSTAGSSSAGSGGAGGVSPMQTAGASGGGGASAGAAGSAPQGGEGGAAGQGNGMDAGDPCVLAIEMQDCCWRHVPVRQSELDTEPCIADYPLDITIIPRQLDLDCRAAQSPICEEGMGPCSMGFFPGPSGAHEGEDGTCVFGR